ncbi:MAG: hypothetical protein K0R51_1715, partial [Cytophagaceae bacterium]|nr:hypothetical protein [Cytophagaceae bacterium]
MNKNVFLLALVIWVTSITANAQVLNKNTTFKLGGLGRSIITSDRLGGDLIAGDTLSPNKGLGGYTLFDLNMDLSINKIFNANTIMRMKNPYGSFYGQDTYFEFRQLQFRGQISRSLKYEFGDIYIGMTPFTVFNAYDPSASRFESDIFKARRDILEYENFYVDNKWRLQGVQLFYNVDSVAIFKQIGVNVFGVRTNITNDANVADRIFVGGRLDLVQSDMLRVGLNAVSYTDLPVSQTEIALKNEVYTADAAFKWENDVLMLGIGGELGTSSFSYKNKVGDTSNAFSDFFYKPEVKAGIKPVKLLVTASYRNVGPQFNSQGAQTQRVNVGVNPAIFPTVNQGTANRGQMLFDRMTEEKIYNRNIAPTLGGFLPQYGNITPYGQATPNRTGFSAGIATDTSLKNIAFEVNIDLLTEVKGEGSPELRKYTGIRGGASVNVGGLLKWNRLLDVTAGVRQENTTRDGDAAVDFKSTIIDAGLAIETLKRVDLIGGVKMLSAKGNEYLSNRNNFNQINGFTAYQYDGSENIYSAGLRFRFAEFAQASVMY